MSERYEPHPIADSLPLMSEDGYAALRDRMAMNGYDSRHPIIIYQGKILDGRHRYRAAIELGIIPAFVHVPDTANPWEVAITGELRRDYGSQTQKAIVLKPLYEKSAEWQAERDRAREAANRARSEAAAESIQTKQRDESGRIVPREPSRTTFGGPTRQHTEPRQPVSQPPKPANRQKAEALAAALGTGRMTAPCTSTTCPRRENCGRHARSRHGVDYSHGPLFEPDHCFWWQPRCTDTRPRERVASLYAGGWP